LIRPLDRAQIYTGVYGGCFLWRRTEIATRRQHRLVGQDQGPHKSTGSRGTELLIRPLEHAQIFT
jgi:hypothetical protein